METTSDQNLICYFGWGRRKYIEQTFPILLNTIRPQDRLLVLDQEMHNFDYYAQFKDQIDYLIFTKKNYRIGPAWELFKYIALWLKTIKHSDVRWFPDYINIIESDALIERGDWIDKLIPLFETEGQKIGIVSGYLGDDDPNTKVIRMIGTTRIKIGSQGVNVIVRTTDFLEIGDYPNYTQDLYFQEKIQDKGRVACFPCIKHIGELGKKKGLIL